MTKFPALRALHHLAAVALCALAGAAATATAQTNWRHDAVPFYDTTHALQSLYGHWAQPRAGDFATAAQALPPALRALCDAPPAQAGAALDAARGAWRSTMLAWESLGAVAVGPVIARRTQRQIDFAPTRPPLIERAIKAQPQGAKAFERVGTPAKGLPALEWLLWTQPAAPATPACRYAVEAALDVEREAVALKAAFDGAATTDWAAEDEQERSTQAMGEFINQWVGGIERLRWAHMEKPLRAAQGSRTPDYPRAASGLTPEAWAAEWKALRTLAVLPQGAALPKPGEALVPLETYLRGRGLNPLADQLLQATQRIDTAFAALAQPGKNTGPQVLQAAKELTALKRLAEAEIAPALQVSIGFSDADGD
ncbi:imelysin family protein [Acidovorax sp. NCPPB 3576]|uniref:imelysin family protein n=1 Tax=Acidovorax sp. NCPPB 3576 TaxID=2940488 RepID=UPI00234B559B|nr:imelysin family protein [Acidovorax sp. NCPPB 3576]WCM87063.1 imelysin family protein [Acidovorax sp. NCPPB 3576]